MASVGREPLPVNLSGNAGGGKGLPPYKDRRRQESKKPLNYFGDQRSYILSVA
jgi:hypothetical protein